MGPPKHVLGMRWGIDAEDAWTSLGLTDTAWMPWDADDAFLIRVSRTGEAVAFDLPATLSIFAAAGRLEGAELVFSDCKRNWPTLRAAVRQAYGLHESEGTSLYERWEKGEVVRLTSDASDDTCRLIVAGPKFGLVYAREILRRGLGALSCGLRP